MANDPREDRNRLYDILASLRDRVGVHRLGDCTGKMHWPQSGVYFFFEDGEYRRSSSALRVVRVGTHALISNSKSTLWKRLRNHRGSAKGGNHRGSVFRLHVGTALIERDQISGPGSASWADKSTAKGKVRQQEQEIEQQVSSHIGKMQVLWVDINDTPGPSSARAFIETHAIRLLSCVGDAGESSDPPSGQWPGQYCRAEQVRKSGLWNVKETEGPYDPAFLDVLESYAFGKGRALSSQTVALVSCVSEKLQRAAPAGELYTSSLFTKSRRYAERHAQRWFILSAKHGLLAGC